MIIRFLSLLFFLNLTCFGSYQWSQEGEPISPPLESSLRSIFDQHFLEEGTSFLVVTSFKTAQVKKNLVIEIFTDSERSSPEVKVVQFSEANIKNLQYSVVKQLPKFLSDTIIIEEKRLFKIQRFWYIGSGIAYSSNINSPGPLFDIELAYTWSIEKFRTFIFWNGSFSTDRENSADYWTLGIHGGRIWPNRLTTLTGGLDLGFGSSKRFTSQFTKEERSYGVFAAARSGVILKKFTASHLELGIRYSLLFDKNYQGTPQTFGTQIGYFF